MIEKIYTVESTAELLNSNAQTIRKLIRDKELKATKKLNKWFILHSDILEYLGSE
jgi:excisionase family DNA binding protein